MPQVDRAPIRVLLACAFITLIVSWGHAEEPIEPAKFVVVDGDTLWMADPLEIIGSRVPVALPSLVRSVNLLSATDVDVLPGRSAAELLQTVPGVKVNQRQQYGVQSDLTIRGSTFEQVQVLLDGFDLSDPQTGHHLMDLPVGRQDIARMEVLPGHGATLYGSGAFGGTVNVVSRRPGDRNGGEMAVTGGGNGTWGIRGNVDLLNPDANLASRLSLETFRTDGYDVRHDNGTLSWGGNDADTFAGTWRATQHGEAYEADFFAGYSARNFGALDFYAPYPSWEETKTAFAAVRYNRSVGDNLTLEPRIFVRRHTDKFILLRDNPSAYTNDHVSRKIGSELRGIIDLDSAHTVAVSLEGAYEDIDSQGIRGGIKAPALGTHQRRRLSVATELDRNVGSFRYQVGARLDTRSGFTPRFSGSGAVSYDLTPALALRTGAGSVYRIPTFTELYYESPVNMGNPNLVAEEGWTWDAGLDLLTGPWRAHLGYFERYEDNVIEWARPLGSDVWQVLNIADGTVRGIETRGAWQHGQGHVFSLGYAWLEKDSTLPGDYEGKYTLLTPRHQLTVQTTLQLAPNLGLTITGRYLEHTAGPDDFRDSFVVDGRLDIRTNGAWFASISGTNLMDQVYEEVPGIQMPGQLLTVTVGRTF